MNTAFEPDTKNPGPSDLMQKTCLFIKSKKVSSSSFRPFWFSYLYLETGIKMFLFYSFQWGFSSVNCIIKLQLRTSPACWYQFSLEHKVTKCYNFAIKYDVCNGISNGTSSGVSETQLLQYTVASSKPAENTDTLWFLLSDLYLRWLHLQYFIYSTIVFLVCH